MNFNEENKVIIETLNEAEARAFVKFLESEIKRHEMDIGNAIELMAVVSNKFKLEEK